MTNTNHFKSIDQLRGIAILLVLASHTFAYAGVRYPAPIKESTLRSASKFLECVFCQIFANGFFGVMIFFVLSGFCIRWSHLNTKHFTWKNFYQRRIFRIIPAYWTWLAIAAVIASAGACDFILHASLLHNVDKDTYLSILPPLWSIAIEWQIYLLYPMILLLASKFCRFHVLTFFALSNLASSFLSSNPVATFIHSDALKILGRLPTALMFSWMLGFYLADAQMAGTKVKCSPLLLCLYIFSGIATYIHSNTCFLASLPWSLAAYQLVGLFIGKGFHWPFVKVDLLAWIGIVSYSVYLSHDLFARCYPWIERMLGIGRGSFLSGLTAFCVLILPMLLIGYLSYRFVEAPGIRLGKFLGSRFNPKSEVRKSIV